MEHDQELNQLLSKRRIFLKHDPEYKTITKAVEKRIKYLRNKKVRQKTDEINENANGRQVEELCKNMRDGNTMFRIIREKQLCDRNKLKNTSRHIVTYAPKSLIQVNLKICQVLLVNFRILTMPK